MFGKNKAKKEKEMFHDQETLVIPEVFYGGQDPYIYQRHEDKKNLEDIKQPEKKKTPVKKSQPKPPVNKSARKKFWIFSIMIFLIAAGLISWYYINDYNKTKAKLLAQNNNNIVNTNNNSQQNNTNNQVVTTVPTSTVQATTTEQLATTTPSLEALFLEFPPILTLDTSDIDSDSLTDIEEEIFDTDSGTWDSDGDNYYDGQEIYNLYNPKGKAPVKLIDSGLIKEYVNPNLGYRLYYPSSWQKGSVDSAETQVLFTASTGEYVEVRFFKKEQGQSFLDWFSRHAEGQNYSDLSSFKNRFEEIAMVRKDSLVAYFEADNYIYTIIYHTKDRGPVFYRHVMQVIYQSFRLPSTTTILPEQVTYPSVLENNNQNITDTVNISLPNTNTTNTENN